MACIYKFTYPGLKNKQDVEQIAIAVGLIVKFVNPDSEGARVDIRFCPPKRPNHKLQAGPTARIKILKQVCSTNMHHTTTRKTSSGGRVRLPDAEQNQPREVLVAFNLDITKDGKFGRTPRVGDHGDSFSSLEFAHNTITEY
jgi:hypothetical protein